MSIPVTFQPHGRKAEVAPGETVWSAAEKARVQLASICGGQSICGKCRIRIIAGQANAISQVEQAFLTGEELQAGLRLACEVRVYEPMTIESPETKEALQSKLELPISSLDLSLSPGVSKVELRVPRASLHDPRSEFARLGDTLKRLGYQPPSLDLRQLKILANVLRDHQYHLTCVFNADRFIALEPGKTTGAFYGIAIDLGTTTIAAYLIHLGSGKQEAALAVSNRQAMYGDDVMSRLSYAQSGGSVQLQQAVIETINDLIRRVCELKDVQPESVYSMTITGNTAMLHFLCGIPTGNLGIAPYVATSLDRIPVQASELGIRINPHSTVWILPGSGAFAGADCVCGVLAAGIAESEQIQLLIDFGTNAEIVLGSSQGIYACAAAAGPAFEGARIEHGMRASPGAIDLVWIDEDRVHVRTIGDLPAAGIAGTGLVSAVAAFRSAGLIDQRGIFHRSKIIADDLWVDGSVTRVILAAGAGDQHPITLSQKDVSEYQLAKAAVRAGITILQRKLGIDDHQIQRIILAGAFGSFMDAAGALAAGLLPAVPAERVKSAGNTAGFGAIAALVSQDQREKLDQLSKSIHYVELSVEPEFNRVFAKALAFN